jgi:hypothetical protein
MFGRSCNDLKDYSEEPPSTISLDDWRTHQEKIVSLIYPAISERIRSGKDKLVQSLNKHRRQLLPSSFPVGSTVMIVDPQRQNKFEPKYIGPYTIVRRSHGGAYVLKDAVGDLLDRKIPPDQMKLISKSKREQDITNPIFYVDHIVEHRGSPGSYEYLVHWKDFPEDERTWEPAMNFLDDQVIKDYWDSLRPSASSSSHS